MLTCVLLLCSRRRRLCRLPFVCFQFFEDGADGDRKSSSTYLKELMGKWESASDMARSAERFGGAPKTTTEEAPTDIDTQKAPEIVPMGATPDAAAAEGGEAGEGGDAGEATEAPPN